MMLRMAWPALGALVLLACAAQVAPTRPQTPTAEKPQDKPVPPANALAAGFAAGPDIGALAISEEGAARALEAFRLSCPVLLKRADRSGLTSGADWQPACAAAASVPANGATAFFRDHFDSAVIGDGAGFATGYYEPEIAGARTPSAAYAVPVYKRPQDLVEVDLGLFSDKLKGRRVRGRVEQGALVPYHDRTAIETGALSGQGLEIGWAADAIDFFFLQIQGSGRLKLPGGGVMRIGYDAQNGRDYTAIGKLLRERGELEAGKAGMAEIVAWLRANPEKGVALMRENKSYVFFRELTGPGPLGALGVAVTPQASVAADPAFVPLGAPVFLTMDRAEANGLWVAQDTGGAIKGANRFDTFWGAGADASRIAGSMTAKGKALVLLPRGVLARLKQGPQAGGSADGGPAAKR